MREKRGRLSLIDMLPDDAWPHVSAAIEALKARKEPAEKIREELNSHLLALGEKPVARSTFNRYSLGLAKEGAHVMQAREAAAIFAEKIGKDKAGDVGLYLSELIKVRCLEILQGVSELELGAQIEILKDMALTIARTEKSREMTVKTEAVIQKEFVQEVADKAEASAKQAGLSAAKARDLRNALLGYSPEKKAA